MSIELGHKNRRLRRIRTSPALRNLVQENHLRASDFIVPVFISDKGTQRTKIPSLPGIERVPLQELVEETQKLIDLGFQAVLLFPVVPTERKSLQAEEAWNPDGIIQQALRDLKKAYPELLLFTDVALDPYTTHGHDGLIDDSGYVLNDETVEALVKQSISLAQAGADFVAPSDMMDGRTHAIREALDKEGFINTGILAYSAKYASAFYGPFREALQSGKKGIDKRSYQLTPANRQEAINEAKFDIEEGADMVMVKPAMPYLDILRDIKNFTEVPAVAYHVSGEYAMLKAACQNGWLDEEKVVEESLLGMKRAGADLIVSYYAQWIAEKGLLNK